MAKRNTLNQVGPWLVMGLGSLIVLGAVIWKTLDVVDKVAATPTPVSSSSNSYIPYPDVARISLEDAKQAYDGGTAVFIDVRDQEYYDQNHITGAINIPYSQIESHLNELDRDQLLILYCT